MIINIEYLECEDSYACSGLAGGTSDIQEVSRRNYFGYIGDFNFYFSLQANSMWYINIWSKKSVRCLSEGICYAEAKNFYVTELNGELYGTYLLPLYDICNDREKKCGKLAITFN